MVRRPEHEAESEAAAKAVAALVGSSKKKKRPKRRAGPTAKGIAKTTAQMEEMRGARDWSDARPAHLVALYCVLHAWCYGVPAAEVIGLTWLAASSAAAKMIRDEFGGEIGESIDFMRWVWKREKSRERWRRENGRDGSRIGWRLQFQQRHLVTDYRIALARRKK